MCLFLLLVFVLAASTAAHRDLRWDVAGVHPDERIVLELENALPRDAVWLQPCGPARSPPRPACRFQLPEGFSVVTTASPARESVFVLRKWNVDRPTVSFSMLVASGVVPPSHVLRVLLPRATEARVSVESSRILRLDVRDSATERQDTLRVAMSPPGEWNTVSVSAAGLATTFGVVQSALLSELWPRPGETPRWFHAELRVPGEGGALWPDPGTWTCSDTRACALATVPTSPPYVPTERDLRRRWVRRLPERSELQLTPTDALLCSSPAEAPWFNLTAPVRPEDVEACLVVAGDVFRLQWNYANVVEVDV